MRGRLSESPVPDVCRRLSDEGVTGALEVSGAPGTGRVFFREGSVYWAMSPAPRAQLGARLVSAGFITQEQLDAALDRQDRAEQRVKLGALLVEDGLVGHDVIRVFVQEQILDALFDLMRWDEGGYVFHAGDAVDEKLPIDVPVAQLLVEASRRLEEWDHVQRAIPSTAAIPDHVVGGNATTAALQPDEFTVLASIDGARSIRDLAADLGYSEFEAARIVYGLMLLGTVEVRPGDAEPTAAAEPPAPTPPPPAPPPLAATPDSDDVDVAAALEEALFGRGAEAGAPATDPGAARGPGEVTVHFDLDRHPGAAPASVGAGSDDGSGEADDATGPAPPAAEPHGVEEPEPWVGRYGYDDEDDQDQDDEAATAPPVTPAANEDPYELRRGLRSVLSELNREPDPSSGASAQEPPPDGASPDDEAAASDTDVPAQHPDEEVATASDDVANDAPPPPPPDAPSAPAPQRHLGDVSEFLLELSRLGDDEDDAEPGANEPPPRRSARPAAEPPADDDEADSGGNRRGLFGWGR